MQFLYRDLGHLDAGDIVVVKLSGHSLNVRLMTPSNFDSYRRGRRHSYHGGHATKSPVRIRVPHAGHWYVTLDRGGYKADFQYSISVEKQSARILPTLAPTAESDIAEIARNLAAAQEELGVAVTHDVFISHASEDKEAVARPLHDRLVELGLTVWLDEIQMRVGAHLRRSIDRGVATCRYGVVIMSPAFFAKQWTQYELDGLVAREMNGEQIILPIWHNITKEELLTIAPSLVDRIALSTAAMTLDDIAGQLAGAVGLEAH